ncbi:hypothetical protein B5F87_19250 [Eubacterium sp. An3]|nr:hypothetical protein B5F87_19250 [Eubacterium sp. An3]
MKEKYETFRQETEGKAKRTCYDESTKISNWKQFLYLLTTKDRRGRTIYKLLAERRKNHGK